MWSMPRNPHRKPKPRASEVSGSNVKLASLSESFWSAVRRSSNWLCVAGKSPQKTTCDGFLIARQRLGRGFEGVGDRVADADVAEPLDVRGDVTDLADAEFVAGDLARSEPAEADDFMLGLAGHQPDLLADL